MSRDSTARRRSTTGLAGLLLALVTLLLPLPTHAVVSVDGGISRTGAPRVLESAVADQGIATTNWLFEHAVITRGSGSIPAALHTSGWVHIGDPDAYGGAVFDAYQGLPGVTEKLFTVSSVDGSTTRLLHRLVPGERYNNSFASISPDGRFLVSGEWGTESRLLVFAIPARLVAGATMPLPLAGIIGLDRPMRDVQGCDFRTAVQLVCSTNDPGTDLYPVARQLLFVDLAHPVTRGTTAGHPALAGSAPVQTLCKGLPGEVEGIDVSGSLVRVSVNATCKDETQLFTLRLSGPRSGGVDVDAAAGWIRPPAVTASLRDARRRTRVARPAGRDQERS